MTAILINDKLLSLCAVDKGKEFRWWGNRTRYGISGGSSSIAVCGREGTLINSQIIQENRQLLDVFTGGSLIFLRDTSLIW